MSASRKAPLRALVLALDAILVVVALGMAGGLHAALRHEVTWLKEPPGFSEYAMIVYLSVPLWLSFTALFGLHRVFERVWTRWSLLFDLAKLHAAGFLGLATAAFFTQATVNRSLVALFLGASFALSYAVRSALGVWQRYQHATGQARTRLLVVGNETPELRLVLQRASEEPRPPIFVGRLGDAGGSLEPHLGQISGIEGVLHENSVDHVLFLPPYHRVAEIGEALEACDTLGISAEVVIETAHPHGVPPRVHELYGMPYLSFETAPKPPDRLAIKHGFDWIVSLVLVVLLLPLLLVTALLIVITMGRPIFFTQPRAGLFGRQFRMIKFRTMVADAEAKKAALADKNEMTGPVFKVTDDPRVTRLGRFLRKSSIDELPQLINVLLGQMSLVGPRPLPIQEQQNIRGWHRRRLSMKPGITGVWQVSGRSNIDFEQWMELDHQYVDEWSLGLDLKILMKTVPVVLLRRGAR